MAPTYSRELIVALGGAFIALPVVFVGLRVWARWLKLRRLQLDDYLCLGALAISISCSSLQILAAIKGQLGEHQSLGPDGQPILDDPRFILFEDTKLAVNIMSVVGLGLVKASILCFYNSIFTVRPFRISVYVMLAIVCSWTLSYFFSNLFICFPVTSLIEPAYKKKCINNVPMWWSMCISDLIVDVFILLMPIPMVLRLQLPWKARLGVLGMFGLGATVCAISAARLATFIQVGNEYIHHLNDVTYYTSPVYYWTNIELATAVVSACLPTLRPIWLHFRPSPPPSSNAYSFGSNKMTGYTEVSGIGLVSMENRDRDLGLETGNGNASWQGRGGKGN